MQKIDMMYAAFTGQPLEKVQQYTERDRFLSVSEVPFKHWNLVSLMGYSKPNIKYDWKPTAMHATFMADIESSQVTWHLMCLLVGSYKSIMPMAFMGYYCFMVEVYVLITSVFFTPKAWDVGPGGNDLGPAI
ncbi:ATP-dependent Clp protease proteolytic subunit 6, chloroplastic [Tanacetum coccineum]